MGSSGDTPSCGTVLLTPVGILLPDLYPILSLSIQTRQSKDYKISSIALVIDSKPSGVFWLQPSETTTLTEG